MITAVHTLIYADDPERARGFLRDVIGWPHVDSGGGWLIFRTGAGELGVHPTSGGGDDSWSIEQHHEISLMCDDIHVTVAELAGRGVEFTRDVRDDGFGLTTEFVVPGAGTMLLYQPLHATAFDLPGGADASRP
jgi:predicted enzyme related to lactoylglutathione lyase